jgi:hypothetical protein
MDGLFSLHEILQDSRIGTNKEYQLIDLKKFMKRLIKSCTSSNPY